VCNRLSTGLSEPHPLSFTLLRSGLLDFLHDQCSPPSEYILIFNYSTKLEQSQVPPARITRSIALLQVLLDRDPGALHRVVLAPSAQFQKEMDACISIYFS
jgi:hypothetical protein